jgi:hypothetical protein
MPGLHLGLEARHDLLRVERTPLLGERDLKCHVQEEIAQLGSESMIVSGVDRVCNFVSLFE